MPINIKVNEKPIINIPKIIVDVPLHKKLERFEQTKLINKSFNAGVLGKPGGGKTSMVHGMLTTKELLQHVFSTIIYFMPPSSRSSIEDPIFDQLNKNDVFDDLNQSNLLQAEKRIHETRDKKEFTLMVFDDVQKDLKGEAEPLLLKLASNRRHLRLCIIIIAQSYKAIPSKVRKLFSDLYIFDLSADDLEAIRQELVPISRKKWLENIEMYLQHNLSAKHDYLYVNTLTRRIFINFDEIVDSDIDKNSQLNSTEIIEKKHVRKSDRGNSSRGTKEKGIEGEDSESSKSREIIDREAKERENFSRPRKTHETSRTLSSSGRSRSSKTHKTQKTTKYRRDKRPGRLIKSTHKHGRKLFEQIFG